MADQLVKITWIDSTTDAGWTPERRLELSECESIGWLIDEDDQQLTIAASRNVAELSWGDRTSIPKPNIRSRVRLAPTQETK